MDSQFQQTKLTKDEWNSIEIPVSSDQQEILELIIQGYSNISYKYNRTPSLFAFMKLDYESAETKNIETFLFSHFFNETIQKHRKKYKFPEKLIPSFSSKQIVTLADLKKPTQIRIQNTFDNIERNKTNIFEFILLENIAKMMKYIPEQNRRWMLYYYTLWHLIQCNVPLLNPVMSEFCKNILTAFEKHIVKLDIIRKAVDYMENNKSILKHANIELFDHQKRLFSFFKKNKGHPKLALYTAPTGTGKTLSPIGLLSEYKVIFVCAARHVGLALSRAAIAAGKKIAFAFGCSSADDIRLHYSAAKEYTKNYRTGGIYKVDNSVGDKVEMIISDVRSYMYAMYYMGAFHSRKNTIMFWDEPTISLDYEDHPLHAIISNIWRENLCPNVVLSSATLPHEHEIQSLVDSFRQKFSDCDLPVETISIVSHDCKKTIPLINPHGFVELPHFLFKNYDQLQDSVDFLIENKTLLRYIDLGEAVRFICSVNELHNSDPTIHLITNPDLYLLENYFDNIDDIHMIKIKIYYLEFLKQINPLHWDYIWSLAQESRRPKLIKNGGGSHDPGIMVTTRDAFSLTDGATIYFATDMEKIGNFCIQQAAIPESVMSALMETLAKNNSLQAKLQVLEKDLEDRMAQYEGQDKKIANDRLDDDTKKLKKRVDEMRTQFNVVTLENVYVPNKPPHLAKWAPIDFDQEANGKPFSSEIDEVLVEEILQLDGVDDSWKILLLMGVGCFSQTQNSRYNEIMKSLADQKKLYFIVANTDYIYGTNYQFCHAYLGKDLEKLTQEKTIQALGRVGRNNIQEHYSIRFRDSKFILKMFEREPDKIEIVNMNKLFTIPPT